MAEEKNSIILYTDLIHTFEQLSDDEAGKLIKHLFRYVNGQNPEVTDRIIQIAFEPIKQQLRRDSEKWENVKGKRSLAGKASAEAKKTAKESQDALTKLTNVENVEQTLTHSTVNVNGNVTANDNVNVNGSVINKNKEVFVVESKNHELVTALVTEFGFSEMKFALQKKNIFQFVTNLEFNGQIDHFVEQFKFYKEWKELSGEKKHSFQSLIGTPAMQFTNSAWNNENWQHKIEQYKADPANQSKFEKLKNTFEEIVNPYVS